MNDIDVIVPGFKNIPYSIISTEIEGIFGSRLTKEFSEIEQYYDVYEHGADYIRAEVDGFVPTDIKIKQAAILIDKEARFMFAVKPDVTISVDMTGIDKEDTETVNSITDQQTIIQNLVDRVLQRTNFADKILKASKDCFIGKRVAYIVNFNQNTGAVNITFVPSLGFVYDTAEDNSDVLKKLIVFYATNDEQDKEEQRYYKKKYEIEDNGKCKITEGLYNGLGELVSDEEVIATDFDYIPGGVILNDGLTGDMSGVSDIGRVMYYEQLQNKLNGSDIDAERKNMNPITYTIDMAATSTAGLSRAPGAYWDMITDPNQEGKQGQIGTIEPKMEYSDALNSTLDRLRIISFENLEIPDVSSKALQGVVSSGKTLKAIYWGLMVQCDAKFIAWKAAIEHMVKTIIDGCKFYPECAINYVKTSVPELEYEILVENNYPIQDDQTEEKEMDLQEVHYKVRSKKSYMKKYLGLSDKDVEEELRQMALERQIEENSYSTLPSFTGNSTANNRQNTPTFNDLLEQERQQNGNE